MYFGHKLHISFYQHFVYFDKLNTLFNGREKPKLANGFSSAKVINFVKINKPKKTWLILFLRCYFF